MDHDIQSYAEDQHSDGCTSLITEAKHQEIFARMTALLKKSGKTIAQVSELTYISERTLSRYFAGKTRDPHFYTICTIIVALGGDINEILGIASHSEAPAENPYGDLLKVYAEETSTLRASLTDVTASLNGLTEEHKAMRRNTRALTIILSIVIIVFLAAEIVDLCNPDWGRYQWITGFARDFLGLI